MICGQPMSCAAGAAWARTAPIDVSRGRDGKNEGAERMEDLSLFFFMSREKGREALSKDGERETIESRRRTANIIQDQEF